MLQPVAIVSGCNAAPVPEAGRVRIRNFSFSRRSDDVFAVPPGDRIRVAVTGVGMVTPCGADRRTSWQRLLAGKGMTRWLQPDELQSCAPFPEQARRLAGAPACRPHTEECQPWLDPVLDLALSAAREALADSRINLAEIDRNRVGCVIGASKGGLRTFANAFRRQHQPGQTQPPRNARDGEEREWEQVFPHAASAWISRTWDLRGPALCPVAACATGLVSAQRAAQLIADGTCDVVLAGSSDASLQEILLASYGRLGVLARGFEDPAAACRPFDRQRSGFLVGEGAGMLLFEWLERRKSSRTAA